jgi:hypothetical protein
MFLGFRGSIQNLKRDGLRGEQVEGGVESRLGRARFAHDPLVIVHRDVGGKLDLAPELGRRVLGPAREGAEVRARQLPLFAVSTSGSDFRVLGLGFRE